MKQNLELERADMYVDRDIQVENGQHIVAYLETLFDVNEKFKLQLDSEAGEWVNMYGIYNPYSDFIAIQCFICTDDKYDDFFYSPTKSEAELIKQMITEKIKEEYNQTPREFCDDVGMREKKAYLYHNRSLTHREMGKRERMNAYCKENGLTIDGSVSINAPMSKSGNELKYMVDYCKARNIQHIVVDEMRDIAETPSECASILNYLHQNGLTLDVVHCDMQFNGQKESEPTGIDIKFGGM